MYYMKKQKRKQHRKKLTMTKRVTRSLLILGVIGGFIPYALSLLDKQPVESMGIAWVTEIVAVCLGYFIRGYKDTAESERIALERDMNGLEMSALYMEDHPTCDDEIPKADDEQPI